MSNLQLRIISAVILAIVVLGLTWVGGFPFRLLSIAIGGAILYEWYMMARPVSDPRGQLLGAVCYGLAALALVLYCPAWVVLLVLAAGVLVCFLFSRLVEHGGNVAGLCLPYAGLSAISLAFLRGDDQSGLIAILFLFAVVWATDIFAYFVGRAVGGPKLAPSISPGKTQSGAVGGALFGVVAGLVLAWVAGAEDWAWIAFIALVLSVVSQAGDLFESWVKRQYGAKDSSTLIPGHGGVMDRVDGLVAAALALYVLGSLGGGLDHPARGLF